MNRKIKFRAWDSTRMIYRELNDRNWYTEEKSGAVVKGTHPDDSYFLKIMQFTGLLDKNGKEIYEGDQLYICAGYSSTVEFKDGMFVSVYKHPEDGEIIPLCDAVGKDTIIIGNIYEN